LKPTETCQTLSGYARPRPSAPRPLGRLPDARLGLRALRLRYGLVVFDEYNRRKNVGQLHTRKLFAAQESEQMNRYHPTQATERPPNGVEEAHTAPHWARIDRHGGFTTATYFDTEGNVVGYQVLDASYLPRDHAAQITGEQRKT